MIPELLLKILIDIASCISTCISFIFIKKFYILSLALSKGNKRKIYAVSKTQLDAIYLLDLRVELAVILHQIRVYIPIIMNARSWNSYRLGIRELDKMEVKFNSSFRMGAGVMIDNELDTIHTCAHDIYCLTEDIKNWYYNHSEKTRNKLSIDISDISTRLQYYQIIIQYNLYNHHREYERQYCGKPNSEYMFHLADFWYYYYYM